MKTFRVRVSITETRERSFYVQGEDFASARKALEEDIDKGGYVYDKTTEETPLAGMSADITLEEEMQSPDDKFLAEFFEENPGEALAI